MKRRKRRHVAIAAVLAVLLAVAAAGAWALSLQLREQGAKQLQEAIIEGAMQCYAVEGTYPASLAHLEDSYGISVDTSMYTVNYQVFAENVMPTVVVVPK